MGFDDDREYDDDFDADISDTDEEKKTVKPKKVSHKGFRQAKKKNAEKAEHSSDSKKSPFHRRSTKGSDQTDPEETDSEMPVFSDKGIGSDSGSSTSSGGHSEFGYLFAPPREGESDDDVYPDSSIYSDGKAAKSMLSGLAYDGSQDSAAASSMPDLTASRPASQFSFNGGSDFSLPGAFSSSGSGAETLKPTPISFDATPAPTAASPDTDSYLPPLRNDSVFISKDERMPTPTPSPVLPNEPEALPTEHDSAPETAGSAEDGTQGESVTQEFLPYGSMYPSYQMNGMSPMNPMGTMMPMMPYPMIIPTGGQNQGNVPYQTIPIPYPMPMPMPMPMYNQYPQYMPMQQPQYIIQQPQPVVQPPQPVQQPQHQSPSHSRSVSHSPYSVQRDDEDRYDDRGYDRYDDRDDRYDYEERRRSRPRYREDGRYAGRGERYDDNRRESRSDRYDRYDRYSRYDDSYDDGYSERASARYQDARRGRYERRSDRYYDRIDARRYEDSRPAERKTYSAPSYDPSPVTPEPILAEKPAPRVDPTPLIQNTPMTSPSPASSSFPRDNMMTGFDLAFDSPSDGLSDLNSFDMNSFGSDIFDPNSSGSSGGETGNTFSRF